MCPDVAKEPLGNKMPILATEKHCFKDTKEKCLCAAYLTESGVKRNRT